tara:strand:- start:329 stop:2419 length:2091 start_codon:yes stop_codon:yes gene_type:complete
MKKNKILIIGGSSYFATNFALHSNQETIILGYHKNFFDFTHLPNILNTKINFKSFDSIYSDIKRINPQILINTSAITDVDLCEENPKKSESINVILATNLALIAKKLNIKYIHISTDQLFDGKKSYYREEDKPNPINIYGKTKFEAENKILKTYKKSLILRSNFFGWGNKYKYKFFDWVYDSLKDSKKIKLYDNIFYTPISIIQISKIILKLISKKKYGIFNVVSNKKISKYDFGLLVAKEFNFDVKNIIPTKYKIFHSIAPRPLDMSLSNKKLKKVLRINIPNIENQIKELNKKNSFKIKENLKPIIPYGKHSINEEDIKLVSNTLRYESLTQGNKVNEFENKIAKYVGCKYAVAVSSCTSGLQLAMQALNLPKNSSAITSPITFVSTSNAMLYNNIRPIFVDINSETINISLREIEKYLKKNKKIRLIVPVHFSGSPCDIIGIKKLAKKYNCYVIEDAAHALGGKYLNGKKIGCSEYSDMAVFSFHPVKQIASGEGGMIVTNNLSLYRELIRLRSHGITKLNDRFIDLNSSTTNNQINPWYYEMQKLSYNFRLTDIQSTLGISQLSRIDKFIKKRSTLSIYYDKHFANFKNIKTVQKKFRKYSALHLYIVLINFKSIKLSRAELMNELKKKGIITQVHYIPVTMHPFYKKLGYKLNNIPKTIKYYNHCISLPLYYDLDKKSQLFVIQTLKDLIN